MLYVRRKRIGMMAGTLPLLLRAVPHLLMSLSKIRKTQLMLMTPLRKSMSRTMEKTPLLSSWESYKRFLMISQSLAIPLVLGEVLDDIL